MKERLSDEKRRMVESLILEGNMKQREIAEAAGVSTYTVYRIKSDIEDARAAQEEIDKQGNGKQAKQKRSEFRTPHNRNGYHISHY